MVDAIKEEAAAKEDCKMRVDAAYAALIEADESIKKMGVDKKILKKIAKAIANEKVGELSEEWKGVGIFMERVFGLVKEE